MSAHLRAFTGYGKERKVSTQLPIAEFPGLVRDAHSILLSIDQAAALVAIHQHVSHRAREAPAGSGTDQTRADVSSSTLPPEGENRLQEITALFVADEGKPPAGSST